jgi:hypothetical protein
MMNKVQPRSEYGVGDMAVDGLLAGIMAGVGMAIYLVLAGLLLGRGMAEMLGLFDPAMAGNALTGTLAHLAVSGVYGVIFALLRMGLQRLRLLRQAQDKLSVFEMSWLMGLVYGLLLFGLARGVLLTAVDSPLLQVTPVHFAIAHTVYGLMLGYWLGKR